MTHMRIFSAIIFLCIAHSIFFITTALGQNPSSNGWVNDSIQIEPTQIDFDCSTVTEIPQIECEALVAIYHALNGPNWSTGFHPFYPGVPWLTTITPCGWKGIQCSNGSISKFEYGDDNLEGYLPDELGNLTNLTALTIHYGPLTSIPTTIGRLTNLRILELYEHQIQTIPDEIGNLINLRVLNLSYNQINNLPSTLANLTNLQELSLQSNRIQHVPDEIGNLSQLITLNLHSNRIETLPIGLSNLSQLEVLHIERNRINVTDPSLRLFLSQKQLNWEDAQTLAPTNLRTTLLAENSLKLSWTPALYKYGGGYYEINVAIDSGDFVVHGTTPDKYSDSYLITDVTQGATYHIRLRTHTFPDPGDVWMLDQYNEIWSAYSHVLTTVVQKNVSGQEIQQEQFVYLPAIYQPRIPATQPQIPSVQRPTNEREPYPRIEANFDCATMDISVSQGECEGLQALYEQNNGGVDWGLNWFKTGGICGWDGIDCVWDGVHSCGYVDENQGRGVCKLDLEDAQIRTIPDEISKLIHITQLDLSNNQISHLSTEIGNLPKLEGLNLHNNRLGSVPPELGNLPKLKRLYLSQNQLTSLPPELSQLTNLWTLDVDDNQLDTIPTTFGQFANLIRLELSGNHLSTLPAGFEHSPISRLHLSYNRFEQFPTELSKLPNLRLLLFSHNQLQTLPPEFGSFSDTRELEIDLSYNQLTTLPIEIGNLTNLYYLYLRGNRLHMLPDELANLPNLRTLDLASNQFTHFPDVVTRLPNIDTLDFSQNQLTNLSAGIGNTTKLYELYLAQNQLTDLPAELANLGYLGEFTLNHNRLTISNDDALTFAGDWVDDEWTETQTVTPTNFAATALSAESIQLTWTPITFQDKGGYYEISVSANGGPFQVHAITHSKQTDTYTLTGLSSGATYQIRLRTYTPPHDGVGTKIDEPKDDQLYASWSDYTETVLVTTP